MISRTICRRSSRVSGVRSSTSCSVTVRMHPLGEILRRRPSLNSSGPSFAMHAWWMRVFSSAYGSRRRRRRPALRAWPAGDGERSRPVGSDLLRPTPFVLLRRSWRPIALAPRRACAAACRASPACATRSAEGLRRSPRSPGRSRTRAPTSTSGLPRLTASGTAPSLGTSKAIFRSRARLDLLRPHADLRVARG